LPFYAYLKHY